MIIRLAGVVSESIVDGPGYRLAVFTQGCPHLCLGCHNQHTHDSAGGRDADTEEVARLLQNKLLQGLTLTGGEPFMQPGPCARLATLAREAGKDVWAYTGYTAEELLQNGDAEVMALLNLIDVLVDGPFLLEKRTLELAFRGSTNQRLIDMPATLRAGRVVLWNYE